MAITKPDISEYPPYYGTYINQANNNDLIKALNESGELFAKFIRSLPAQKLDYRYAEGKWNIKEIVSHITDSERVFTYRALTFSRNDKSELPGYDENIWAPESNATGRNIKDIIEEYENVRKATISLFEGFTETMIMRKGIANGREISVRALGYILPGHEIHHMGVIKERYLK